MRHAELTYAKTANITVEHDTTLNLPKYYGILKGYPRIRKAFGKISDYLSLCRPFTVFGAFISGVFLDLLFSRLSPRGVDFGHSLLVGLTLAFIQGGGQALNQSIAEEVEIDRINGKTYRPTVNGRLSLRDGKSISVLLFLSGITSAFYLSRLYGLFSILITFFAVAYTIPPLRVKKYFLANNLWQGFARGFLPAIYVSLAYEGYGLLPILFGIALALWVTGAQATKDFNDVQGDTLYQIRTMPVVLGKNGALRLMSVFMAIGFLIINLCILYGLFPLSFLTLNILVVPSIVIIWALRKNLKVGFAENNTSWVCFYGTLGLFYIIPALVI